MVKKKKDADTSNDTIPAYQKKMIKDYGDILIDAIDIENQVSKIVPVSPILDIGLNGGIPEGTWSIFSGPEKCGKSSLALQIAANAQKLYDKKIFVGDVEGRFEKIHLHSVQDLDISKIKVVKSNQSKILSAEEHLEAYKSILKNEPGCVLIIDSASALSSEAELTSEIKTMGRNNGPKLLASFCRQMGQVIPIQKSIVIIIQHLIANTSGYGAPFMEDGGNKLKYQSDIKMRCKGVKKWLDTNDKPIGQAVVWDILYSALGAPTGKCTSFLRYGYGIDSTMEILSLALELGVVMKGGAWYSYKDSKFQGELKMYEYLKSYPIIQKEIEDNIKQIL